MFDRYKCNHWQIAYRRNPKDEFSLVDNPSWGWCADPFLVEYQGEVYLFAEIFLYKSERNGVIGYCKFDGEKFGEWEVTMDRPWHLSYPNVFVYNEHLYMCPESYQLEEIAIYELKAFPNQWEKIRTIVKNKKCVDSTFIEWDSKTYMYTFEPLFKNNEGTLQLYQLSESASFLGSITADKRGARSGGKVINKNGKFFRVGQNCESEYGAGLIFYEIESVYPYYKEKEVEMLCPSMLGEKFKKYNGIHTYNNLGNLEVIDLKYKSFSIVEQLARKRVRKVFTNKY